MTWQSILGSPDPFTVGADADLEAYSDWTRSDGNGGGGELRILAANDYVTCPTNAEYGVYRKANGSVSSPNHEARATVTIAGSSGHVNVGCRIGTNLTGYLARVDPSNGDLVIWKYVNGTGNALATQAASYSGTQTLRLRAVTNGANVDLTAQWGANAELTVTDDGTVGGSPLTAQGYPGISIYRSGGASSQVDSFDIWQDVGGTTYPQSVAGGITPSGGLGRQPQKPIGGGITPSAALLRQVQKPVTGGMTPAAALLQQAQKPLAGSVTPSAAMAKELQRVVAGSITPTGAFTKVLERLLDGSITPTSTLTQLKIILLALAGSLTPAGVLQQQVAKALLATLTPTGDVTEFGVGINSLAGTLQPSGEVTRQTQKPLTGSLTPTGGLGITRVLLLALTGNLAPAGALVRSMLVNLAGNLAAEATLQRAIGKGLVGTVTPVGTLQKLIARTLAGVLGLAASVVNALVGVIRTRLDATDYSGVRYRIQDHSTARYGLTDHSGE